jgi:transcriptional regulator with XRE-family HTH domain
MDDLTGQQIGRRVAHWRERRGMTQQVFAGRLGKSTSWVTKIESGDRRLEKISILYEVAEALEIDIQVLLDKPPHRPAEGGTHHPIGIDEIQTILECYDPAQPATAPGTAQPVQALSRAIDTAWLAWQHANYLSLGQALPQMLRDAQRPDPAGIRADTDDARTAAHLLAQTYQVASSLLHKVGEPHLAWLAADRAVTMARLAGDALLAGLGSCQVILALLATHRTRSALTLSVATADRLVRNHRSPAAAQPDWLSVHGSVLLHGAFAAAQTDDTATMAALLGHADKAAERLGGDRTHYWTCFGPTAVQMCRVACAVALRRGAAAVRRAEDVRDTDLRSLPPVWRADHYLMAARGYVMADQADRAGEMVLLCHQTAPWEVRCRPSARALLGEVSRRAGAASAVRHLAKRVGVA